jgi:hypothetical protein
MPSFDYIQSLVADVEGARTFVRQLFANAKTDNLLDALLDFRQHSVTRIVKSIVRQAKSQGLPVGLDCFSPSLTRMVGQDLTALKETCEWVKIMTYPRVFGPAGLPFEFMCLAEWLITRYGLSEAEALKLVADAGGLSLPSSCAKLRSTGLDSGSIRREIRLGRAQGVKNLLAGVPMVEMAGIHQTTEVQLRTDLSACREADGLVLSWDLWHIPLERLELVGNIWPSFY